MDRVVAGFEGFYLAGALALPVLCALCLLWHFLERRK